MKNRIIVITLITLIAILSLSTLTASVKASGNLSGQASVSSTDSGVAQDSSYTITIKNTGTTNLGAANITIPAGYSNIRNLGITQQPGSENWTITKQITKQGNYILLYGSAQGLSQGQSITFTFEAKNPIAEGNNKWVIGANENTTLSGLNTPELTLNVNYTVLITSVLAATLILFIAAVIALVNTVVNRVLINHFVGWEQYRVMQKEMNEYRSETMAAARANDKKAMEKLKKRQSQINAMQAKMLKPQMVQLGISFIYIIVWFAVLIPDFGNTSMVYLPGFGPINVIWWYPICSFFLGLVASRLLGIMPIEP
jgi:uncharacterized membrane protein (DUF106 family)